MLLDAFGRLLYVENRLNLPRFQHVDKLFRSQLELFVSQPYIQNIKSDEQNGNAYTSVTRTSALNTLGGFNELLQDLHPYVLSARDALLPWPKLGELKLGRAWVNYMFRGCRGASHTHHKHDVDLVCIFYLDIPTGSSSLAIIDDAVSNKLDIDYPEDKKIIIEPQPYSLVVHTSDVMHAITEHMSYDKRVAIIFEMSVESI